MRGAICSSGLAVFSSFCVAQPASPIPAVVTVDQLPALQAELGLSAVNLALSGFQASDATSIRTALLQSSSASALLDARRSVTAAARQLAVLRELPDMGGELALQQAAVFASAQAALTSARAQVFEGLRVAVVSPAWATFDRVRAAPAGLPAEMRVLDWSGVQLEALSKAVFAERKAQGDPSQVSAADRALLDAARISVAVVDAAQRVQQRSGEIGVALRGLGS